MYNKLVIALAVFSLGSIEATAAINTNGSPVNSPAPIQESTEQTSIESEQPTWLKQESLNFKLLESDYNAWSKSIQSDYPSQSQQLVIYKTAIEQGYQQTPLVADYVTLLGWNGLYIQAVNFYQENLTERDLPAFALNVLAMSAREVYQYDLSRQLYLKALSSAPNYRNAQLGLAALDIREGHLEQAEKSLKSIVESDPGNDEALTLLAYLYNQQPSKTLDEVATYDQLMATNPDDPEAIRLRTLNLIELQILGSAEQAMTEHPDYYHEEDWLTLLAAQNTKLVRRLNRDTRAAEDSQFLEQALTKNTQYIKRLEQSPVVNEKRLVTAIADRMLILNKAGRHDEVIGLAQQYDDYRPLLPDYGIIMMADSYQAQNQSYIAHELLEEGLKTGQISQSNNQALKASYYAAMDSGQYEAAEDYLTQLQANNPQWNYSNDGKRRLANPEFTSVQLMHAMHFAFIGQLERAQLELGVLLKTAPANNEIRKNYADVLRWRGFIEASNSQLTIIEATDKQYQPAQTSKIYNLIASREYAKARHQIKDIEQPNSQEAQRLLNDFDIETSAKLYISTSLANSSGSDFSSNDRQFAASAYSALIEDHWRVFAKAQTNRSKFFQINDSVTSTGFGIQYADKYHISEAELYQVNGLGGVDVGLNSNILFNDSFSLFLQYQSYNQQTPVRAHYAGVSSDLNALSFTYRLDDKQRYSIGYQASDFSDGNQRQSMSLSGSQLVYQDYYQRLSFSEFYYQEDNSADSNRFYFNPDSLSSISLAVSYSQLLYKHAPVDFWHTFNLEFGNYSQQGFDAEPIWGISYQHEWQLSQRSYLNYSFGYRQSFYDGQKETGPIFQLTYGLVL